MAQNETSADPEKIKLGFNTLVFSDRDYTSKSLDKTVKSFDETVIQPIKVTDNLACSKTVEKKEKTFKPSDCLGSNLQYLRNNPLLSVSLKTLPEDDFSSTTDCSNRRGSNQSLSMNMEETSSCSSKQNQFQRTKKNLLQRRNSNTSLALNIQHSNSSLNRFNSHNSLNCIHHSTNNAADRGTRKGLLDLNYSMCSLSTNGINKKPSSTLQTEQAHCNDQYRRKFLSSENIHILFNTASHNSKYQSCKFKYDMGEQTENAQIFDFSKDIVEADGICDINDDQYSDNACNKITIKTKPLSPQSTSEDFKIHLANLHFLENATNPLSVEYLSNLNCAFNTTSNSKCLSKAPGLFTMTAEVVTMDGCDNCNHKPNESDENKRTTCNKKKVDNFFSNKMKSSPHCEINASEQHKKKSLVKLHQEFWEIPTNFQDKPVVFGQNHKNRYKSILPNEISRVILQPDSSTEPYINANYIKGPDYKTNYYIATQGPMPNTIYEFWLMIYQENQKHSHIGLNYSKIAMLTNFVENQCSVYFPIDKNELVAFTNSTNAKLDNELVVENSSVIYDEIKQSKLQTKLEQSVSSFAPNYNYFLIKNIDVCHKNGYSIRKLNIVYRNCGRSDQKTTECDKKYEFYVVHYWFIDWPDHRSPEHVDFLLDMSLDLLDIGPGSNFPKTMNDEAYYKTSGMLQAESYKSRMRENQKFALKMTSSREDNQTMASDDSVGLLVSKPLLTIHCSAGIGRTGCLAAILNGLGQMMRYKHSKSKTDHDETHCVQSNIKVDILRIVCNLRLCRGGMVQNSEQYELIHRTLCLYQERLSTE